MSSGRTPPPSQVSAQACSRCCRRRDPGTRARSHGLPPGFRGALDSPTLGTMAASSCSSPSSIRSGGRFPCDPDSLCHLVHIRVLCASLGGVAEHGNLRLRADQHLKDLGGRLCDSRQLFGCGILVQAAVRKHEHALLTVLAVRNAHHKESGIRALCQALS